MKYRLIVILGWVFVTPLNWLDARISAAYMRALDRADTSTIPKRRFAHNEAMD